MPQEANYGTVVNTRGIIRVDGVIHAKLGGLIVSGVVLVVGELLAVAGALLGWWPYAGAILASAMIVLAAGWLLPVRTAGGLQRFVLLGLTLTAALVTIGLLTRSGREVLVGLLIATGTLRTWRQAAPGRQSSVRATTRVLGLATVVLAGVVAFVVGPGERLLDAALVAAMGGFLIADGPGWNISVRW